MHLKESVFTVYSKTALKSSLVPQCNSKFKGLELFFSELEVGFAVFAGDGTVPFWVPFSSELLT